MDNNERLNKAYSLAQLAVEKDRAEQFKEALELYKLTLDNFNYVVKYHTNQALKEKLYEKMEELITRAEQIKVYLKNNKENGTPPTEGAQSAGGKKKVSTADKDSDFKPRLSNAIISDKPNVHWSDIAGLAAAKSSLQEAVILPTRFPSLFTGDRKPWKGILLYGPPGTGKTYLAKACATEADSTFLSVSSSDLMSKWQGESEKLVRTLFEMAREKKPAIIFIDEVDSMCSARGAGESESSRRIKTEFLVQMQGVGNDSTGILVLGATNVPWELDSAIRRRFERRIYIPLPDEEGRRHMIQLAMKNTPNNLKPQDIEAIVRKTDGFSGADISIMVRDALFQPIRKCQLAKHFKTVEKNGKEYYTPCSPDDPDPSKQEMNLMSISKDDLLAPELTRKDFLDVLASARPSVGEEDLKKHVEWTNQYGQEGN